MNIQIDSWQSAMVFGLTLLAVLSALATLHWKVFAEPLLKRILSPYGDRLDAVTHVVRTKFPQEYRAAMESVIDERPLRNAI